MPGMPPFCYFRECMCVSVCMFRLPKRSARAPGQPQAACSTQNSVCWRRVRCVFSPLRFVSFSRPRLIGRRYAANGTTAGVCVCVNNADSICVRVCVHFPLGVFPFRSLHFFLPFLFVLLSWVDFVVCRRGGWCWGGGASSVCVGLRVCESVCVYLREVGLSLCVCVFTSSYGAHFACFLPLLPVIHLCLPPPPPRPLWLALPTYWRVLFAFSRWFHAKFTNFMWTFIVCITVAAGRLSKCIGVCVCVENLK